MTKAARAALIRDNMDYAIRLAHQFYRDRTNLGIDQDDFVGAALLGLCEAARRFETGKGNFKTFSYFRIRGSMYDLLRRSGGISRTHFSELVQAATPGNKEQREPRLPYAFAKDITELAALREVIDQFGIRLHLCPARGKTQLSYAAEHSPESATVSHDMGRYLEDLLSRIPERERRILRCHYYEELTFDEMRERFGGISKSWLSRLHLKAIARLRTMMQQDAALCSERREERTAA